MEQSTKMSVGSVFCTQFGKLTCLQGSLEFNGREHNFGGRFEIDADCESVVDYDTDRWETPDYN